MSTKPSATIVYITPESSPPMSTSRKNAISQSLFCKGPEVRLDDRRIRADARGRSIRDLLSVVEDDDVIGQIHHDAEVVLDEDERRAESLSGVDHEAAHVPLLVDGHACHRLVEEEELRVSGESSGELDPLLQPVGEATHDIGPVLRDLQQRE